MYLNICHQGNKHMLSVLEL